MKAIATATTWLMLLGLILAGAEDLRAQDYVGSDTCIGCHSAMQPDLVAEYEKTGHPYKLNPLDGMPPLYPAHTSPGVPNPPPNTEWGDFVYAIGGYGWKARFVKPDGRIYTAGTEAQFNLFAQSLGLNDKVWVPYHQDEDKKYDYGCFQCHTTGATPDGSWNGVPEDSLGTFNEPGIRCEGCHGPGSDHVANPTVKPPNRGEDLTITRCGDCHQRGGITNAIPASSNFIRHHEQLNEMRASKHGDGNGADLTCASCHEPHVALRYPEAAGEGMTGITTDCETCHPNYEIPFNNGLKPIECIDCHMAEASKSALGYAMGNGWRGDVKTHIWGINTEPVTREAMFTADGGLIALDENNLASVTLDFACLNCHTDRNVSWASSHAIGIHRGGIQTDVEAVADVPGAFILEQNYPNPFNPTTTIAFDLPKAEPVTLRIYGLEGRLLATLVDNRMPPGRHTVKVDLGILASGVYVYELRAGDFVATKTMVLLK